MQFDKTNQRLYVLDRNSTIYVVNTENDAQLSPNIKLSLPLTNNSLAKPNDMVLDLTNKILYVKYDALNIITAINVAPSNPSPQQVNIKLAYKIPNDKTHAKNVDSYFPGALSIGQHGVVYFTVGENKDIRADNVYRDVNGIYMLNQTDKIFKKHSQYSPGPKYVSIKVKGEKNVILPNGTSIKVEGEKNVILPNGT